MENNLKKGDIYYADLGDTAGSEQNGIRPVLIIQNDIGNKYSPTTIVAAITTNNKKTSLPTHVVLNKDCGLTKRSMVMLEQIRTIDKSRLNTKIGQCDKKTLNMVNDAIKVSFFAGDK